MIFLRKDEILSLEELRRLLDIFIRNGVKKLRLTGGEPLVRRDIMWLIQRLGRRVADGSLDELTLTTNGTQLDRFASQLADAGIRRINVSLDSLDNEKFTRITRWGRLTQVLSGIDAAKKAGLKIKINTVAMAGVNENEFDHLIQWCGDNGFDLSFIEVMPMGDMGNESRLDQYLPLSRVRDNLAKKWALDPSTKTTGGPARYVHVRETGGHLGFITPLSHNFCEGCNRVRLTCTGRLYMCLGQEDAADLRSPLRNSVHDGPVEAAIADAISRKPRGHDFIIDRDHNAPAVPRHMSVTGG